MGQFVTDDIQRNREAIKDLAVTVTKDHLDRVPESVIVILAEMHGGVQRHPRIINGIPVEHLLEKIEGGTKPIIGFVHGNIAGGTLAFSTDQRAWQVLGMVGRVDSASFLRGYYRSARGLPLGREPGGLGSEPQGAECVVDGLRPQSSRSLLRRALIDDFVDNIGRNDAENRIPAVSMLTHRNTSSSLSNQLPTS